MYVGSWVGIRLVHKPKIIDHITQHEIQNFNFNSLKT